VTFCPHCGNPTYGWTVAEIGWDCAYLDGMQKLDSRDELGEAGA